MDKFDFNKCSDGIKAHRLERGLSRKELADLAGIDYSHLINIESGEKHPSALTLISILNALLIDVSDCLECPTIDCNKTYYLQKLKSVFKQLNKKELYFIHNVVLHIKNLEDENIGF